MTKPREQYINNPLWTAWRGSPTSPHPFRRVLQSRRHHLPLTLQLDRRCDQKWLAKWKAYNDKVDASCYTRREGARAPRAGVSAERRCLIYGVLSSPARDIWANSSCSPEKLSSLNNVAQPRVGWKSRWHHTEKMVPHIQHGSLKMCRRTTRGPQGCMVSLPI